MFAINTSIALMCGLFFIGLFVLIPKGNKWRILVGALAVIYNVLWVMANIDLLFALAVLLLSIAGVSYVSLRLAAVYGVEWAQRSVNWAHRNLTPNALRNRRKGLNEYGLIPLTDDEKIRARNAKGVKPLDD